jgi:hypothetical protein
MMKKNSTLNTEAYAFDLAVFPWDAARVLLICCILVVLAGCFYYAWTSAREAYREWQDKRPLLSRSARLYHVRSRPGSPSHYTTYRRTTRDGEFIDEESMIQAYTTRRYPNHHWKRSTSRTRVSLPVFTVETVVTPPSDTPSPSSTTWTQRAVHAGSGDDHNVLTTIATCDSPTKTACTQASSIDALSMLTTH